MGVVVGFGVGLGLLLVWSAFAMPRTATRAGPSRLRVSLDRAGLVGVQVRTLLALSVSLFVVVTLAVQLLSSTLPVALAFGLMAAYLPFAALTGRVRRRQLELAEVWPDAVDNLASAVRAGMSLAEAVSGLAVRGPEPLRPSFDVFAREYQTSGRFGDCLDRLKERLADPVGDRVVEGLRVAREGTLDDCCGTSPGTCATTPGRGPSWRPGRAGRSTGPGWPSPRRGWCSCCCASNAR